MGKAWTYCKLSDISSVKSGYTPSEYLLNNVGDVPYFKVGDMNMEANLKYLQDSDSYINYPCKTFPKGSVAFPKNGAAIATNKKRILRQDSVVDLNTAVLIPDKSINTEFLYYWIQHIDFRNITRRGAVPTLDLKELKEFPFPLISLQEQERIVAELDLLTDIIGKQKAQLKELDTLASSIFYDMFGNPVDNDKGWETNPMKKVAPMEQYNGKIPDKNGKYWLLNLDMVAQQTGEIIEKRLFSKDEIGNSTITFDETNVLYSKLRPYLNKVAIPNEKGYGTSELIPLKPDATILERCFLTHLLRSKPFVNYISGKVAGAKMPRVTMGTFWGFPIILPPLSLQQSFAEKIDAIERQKANINASIAETQKLFDYTMDKYFG